MRRTLFCLPCHPPACPATPRYREPALRRRALAIRLLQALLFSSGAQAAVVHAKGVQFNAAFLPMDSRDLDLSQYREGNPVKPGTYRADVVVNGSMRTRHDIRIEGDPDGSAPLICITPRLLHTLGVDPSHVQETAGDADCVELPFLVDGATASFALEDHQLHLSIPQIALMRQARGYVSPELWDAGVTAGILGYSFSAHTVQTPAGNHESASLWLDGGFNIGSWRMRHMGSMRWDGKSGARYEALDSFVQHDLTSWRSQLTVGQTNTRSDVFDTLRFEGIQLASDDRMLPNSLRGYAPVVRGIARTTARVAVRQGGHLLLETTVAPGAFVIDDLYATGYGGNLDVTVSEDDGTEQKFVIPYASVNQLLRPGAARYAATVGRLRSPYLDQAQFFLQGELQYGLNNRLTTYGGLQAAEGYLSFVGGLAFATPIGAMAVDLSHATATIGGEDRDGQSLRLSYSKQLLARGTNFSLAAYRFSTRGYLDFATAALQLDGGACLFECFRPQSRLAVNVDQQLGRFGHVSFSGYSQTYWGSTQRDLQYQVSYSRQMGRASFGLSMSRTQAKHGAADNRLLATLSVPLGAREERAPLQFAAQLGRNARTGGDGRVSLNGTAGADRQYSYGVSLARDASAGNSLSANGQWVGARSSVNGTVSSGSGYRSAAFGASGTIVAHRSGLTFSPFKGETMAIIHAPGAGGARIAGYPGMRLDQRGLAVVPYLRPYELNEVAIDPAGTPMDVELRETSQQVAPRAGAVLMVQYDTHRGRALLAQTRQEDGQAVPFGATVVDASGNSVGVVGQAGQLYARVPDGTQALHVRWGNSGQHCSISVASMQPDATSPGTLLCLRSQALQTGAQN